MERKRKLGLATVMGSYVLWGTLTIFWNLLGQVNPVYILSQRIIWSMVLIGIFLLLTHGMGEVKEAFRNRKTLRQSLICGVLITMNWGVYIYSVTSGHVLEASMGYFIEPVLVVLVGVIAFRERPTRGETLTLLFAVGGILYLLVRTGSIPMLALLIGAPFAVYGGVKKNLTLSAPASLFMETVCVFPLALAFSLWWEAQAGGSAGALQGASFWLLPASGFVTSFPLLLFNMGVKEIPYYFSGILMYINPTLQFLVGILYFGEKMDPAEFVAFVIIWVGILFTLAEKVALIRKEKHGEKELAAGKDVPAKTH